MNKVPQIVVVLCLFTLGVITITPLEHTEANDWVKSRTFYFTLYLSTGTLTLDYVIVDWEYHHGDEEGHQHPPASLATAVRVLP